MKKIILIYLICIIGLFFLPAILVKEYTDINLDSNKEVVKIKLLLTENNEIVEMSLDDYVMGVLIGEMPVDYNLEALKAQAVVARTYTLNKIINSYDAHENSDMCDDINHCQAYKTKEYALSCWSDDEENEKWNKIKKAVLETSNIVITYNDELINAFFHANSGGKTEDISNIWGHENIPYLKSVDSYEVDKIIENVTLTYEELDKIMQEKYINYISIKNELLKNEKNVNMQSNNEIADDLTEDVKDFENQREDYIKILETNSSGRVSKMQISNIVLEGTEVRSIFGLRSTLFTIKFESDNIVFETKGYGHGIGMSQYGANDMANNGKTYQDIIKHYYTGVELKGF